MCCASEPSEPTYKKKLLCLKPDHPPTIPPLYFLCFLPALRVFLFLIS